MPELSLCSSRTGVSLLSLYLPYIWVLTGQEGKGNSISGEDTEKEWHQRMPQDFELTPIKKVFSICLLTLEYYSVLGLSQRSYD